MPNPSILLHRKPDVLVMEFNTGIETNPFNNEVMDTLTLALTNASNDPSVKALIMYGGKDKSFCAGGDFKEVQNMRDPNDVSIWIDRVIKLYQTSLRVNKPVIAAIDNYAIGIGFQLALTADWRIGTYKTEFRMPELEKGIAAPLAYTMLNPYGRGWAQQLIIGCKGVQYEKAQECGFLHKVVKSEELLEEAIKEATSLAKFPTVPFLTTKPVLNSKLIQDLSLIQGPATSAHCQSFAARSADQHLKNILKDKYSGDANHFKWGERTNTGASIQISGKNYSTVTDLHSKIPYNPSFASKMDVTALKLPRTPFQATMTHTSHLSMPRINIPFR